RGAPGHAENDGQAPPELVNPRWLARASSVHFLSYCPIGTNRNRINVWRSLGRRSLGVLWRLYRMTTRAQWFLWPMLVLPLALLRGCQMKSTAATEKTPLVWGNEVHGLRCSLTLPSNHWQNGAPVVVPVTLENRSDRKVELASIPAFELGGYWCPVNLLKDGHGLAANERCRLVLP